MALHPMHTLALTTHDWLNLAYLLAASLFIVGLKMLSNVKTAARGNLISAGGMLIAAVATFFYITGGQTISLLWIALALLLGSGIGLWRAVTVEMTAMPQTVALFNGFGGIASLLVATADYATAYTDGYIPLQTWHTLLATGLAALIGGVTFSGSLIAFGKLQGLRITPGAPIQFAGQKALIFAMLLGALILSAYLIVNPDFAFGLIIIAILALTLGVLLVIGIGGADMPVVISLLNSYSGLAAAMAGFVLNNVALIVTGALVGASGIILTSIMCKAMNRSLANVLFGGVGATATAGTSTGGPQGTAREVNAEDVAIQLDAARQVMIVPGYGMAVAQAQHSVSELAQELDRRGIKVFYAIHPVAGRMPGHMNVLLAEASVPYEQLLDLDQSNAEFEQSDVALVIGANDVTNPAARHDKQSPIYGMPILDVDKSRSVIVIKRSMNPGFAGIENELYYKPNCAMLFGDGKAMVNALVAELKQL